MWPMSAQHIFEILTGTPCPNKNFSNLLIESISQDSRTIKNNQIFAAIRGDKFDGHDYLKQCFQASVPLAIVEKKLSCLKNAG